MARSNESDEIALGLSIGAKEEAMAAWRYWLRCGENDKVGGQIIRDIGKIADGDADLIAFLEERTSSGIYPVAIAAVYALSNLAHRGDPLAREAIGRYDDKKRREQAAKEQARLKQQQENDQAYAKKLGLTLEELYAQREADRLAEIDRHKKRQQELALPSKFYPGQRVKCVIQNWPYTGAIGTVERATTKYFVTVKFDDGYRTIQADYAFELVT